MSKLFWCILLLATAGLSMNVGCARGPEYGEEGQGMEDETMGEVTAEEAGKAP